MRSSLRAVLCVASVACASLAFPAQPRGEDVEELLEFGVEMALKANWREARYRWERAAAESPADPRVLNNLAVSAEALGRPEEARTLYGRALAVPGADYRIRDNSRRSERFWSQAGRDATADAPRPPTAPQDLGRGKRRAAVELDVQLPVPARVHLGEAKSLLVASFLVDETELLDVNREIVRFLRGEFRKRTGLEVLDVTPAPAIPEQTVEDLVAILARFDPANYDPVACRQNAERFGVERFSGELQAVIART